MILKRCRRESRARDVMQLLGSLSITQTALGLGPALRCSDTGLHSQHLGGEAGTSQVQGHLQLQRELKASQSYVKFCLKNNDDKKHCIHIETHKQ